MLFEFIYVAIALVVGILKWQQARTGRDKAIAIVSAALWPITYLIQELSPRPGIWITEERKGDDK